MPQVCHKLFLANAPTIPSAVTGRALAFMIVDNVLCLVLQGQEEQAGGHLQSRGFPYTARGAQR